MMVPRKNLADIVTVGLALHIGLRGIGATRREFVNKMSEMVYVFNTCATSIQMLRVSCIHDHLV